MAVYILVLHAAPAHAAVASTCSCLPVQPPQKGQGPPNGRRHEAAHAAAGPFCAVDVSCAESRAQALHPLFAAGEDAGTRDNAAGAVGRIISALGPQLPLQQVPSCHGPHWA